MFAPPVEPAFDFVTDFVADESLGDWLIADIGAPGSAARPLGPHEVLAKGTRNYLHNPAASSASRLFFE